MSNPTITPGYGYVICSHDDPKRSHILNECSEWNQPCHGECDKCAKFPARKPVEIPDGWELVPEGEVPPREHQWYYTIDKYWREGGTRYNSFYEAFRCTYGNANHGAFIRRKPVQPTVEPSKPAVDWSKPIQTRAGRKARLLGEIIGRDDPFAVAVMTEDGREYVLYYFASGKFYVNATCVNDIINAPERIKRDVWLNVYQHSECCGYDSKYEADDCATQTRIACVRVQIDCEKGEGL
jgi:hypothetical protein